MSSRYLKDVELPKLKNATFGDTIKESLEDINYNFQKLGNINLTKGAKGDSCIYVPFNLNCLFDGGWKADESDPNFICFRDTTNLTDDDYKDACRCLVEMISAALPDDVSWTYQVITEETNSSGEKVVRTESKTWHSNWLAYWLELSTSEPTDENKKKIQEYANQYRNFWPGNVVLALTKSAKVGNGDIVDHLGNLWYPAGSMAFIYFDPRYKNSPEELKKIQSIKLTSDEIEEIGDCSCVMYLGVDANGDYCMNSVDAFPTIYRKKEDGKYYLKIKGEETDIMISGEKGDPGKAADFVIATRMVKPDKKVNSFIDQKDIDEYEKSNHFFIKSIVDFDDNLSNKSVLSGDLTVGTPCVIMPDSSETLVPRPIWFSTVVAKVTVGDAGEEAFLVYCSESNQFTPQAIDTQTWVEMYALLNAYSKQFNSTGLDHVRGLMIPIGTFDRFDKDGISQDVGAAHIIYSDVAGYADLANRLQSDPASTNYRNWRNGVNIALGSSVMGTGDARKVYNKRVLHIGSVDDYRNLNQGPDSRDFITDPSTPKDNVFKDVSGNTERLGAVLHIDEPTTITRYRDRWTGMRSGANEGPMLPLLNVEGDVVIGPKYHANKNGSWDKGQGGLIVLGDIEDTNAAWNGYGLYVKNNSYLGSNLDVVGDLTVNGDTSLGGPLNVRKGKTTLKELEVFEKSTLKDLEVTGSTQLSGSFTVGTESKPQNSTLNGDLTVTGETNLKDTKVSGDLIIENNGSLDLSGNVKASYNTSPASTFVIGVNSSNGFDQGFKLGVKGNTHIIGTLHVTDLATLENGLSVTKSGMKVVGNSTLTGSLTISSGGLTVGAAGSPQDIKLYGTVYNSSGRTIIGQTTIVGFEGYALGVNGSARILSNLDVDNDLTVEKEGHIKHSLYVAEDTSGSYRLIVGTTTLKNNEIDFLDRKFGVLGNAKIIGELMVSKGVEIGGGLGVKGTTTLEDKLSVTQNGADIQGPVECHDTLTSHGLFTVKNAGADINGRVKITGGDLIVGELNDQRGTFLHGNLTVGDSSKYTETLLYSNLDIRGTAIVNNTLEVTGATTLKNTLGVTGATTLGSTLEVTGATTLKNTLTVSEATTLRKTLDVLGVTNLAAELNVNGGGYIFLYNGQWCVRRYTDSGSNVHMFLGATQRAFNGDDDKYKIDILRGIDIGKNQTIIGNYTTINKNLVVGETNENSGSIVLYGSGGSPGGTLAMLQRTREMSPKVYDCHNREIADGVIGAYIDASYKVLQENIGFSSDYPTNIYSDIKPGYDKWMPDGNERYHWQFPTGAGAIIDDGNGGKRQQWVGDIISASLGNSSFSNYVNKKEGDQYITYVRFFRAQDSASSLEPKYVTDDAATKLTSKSDIYIRYVKGSDEKWVKWEDVRDSEGRVRYRLDDGYVLGGVSTSIQTTRNGDTFWHTDTVFGNKPSLLVGYYQMVVRRAASSKLLQTMNLSHKSSNGGHNKSTTHNWEKNRDYIKKYFWSGRDGSEIYTSDYRLSLAHGASARIAADGKRIPADDTTTPVECTLTTLGVPGMADAMYCDGSISITGGGGIFFYNGAHVAMGLSETKVRAVHSKDSESYNEDVSQMQTGWSVFGARDMNRPFWPVKFSDGTKYCIAFGGGTYGSKYYPSEPWMAYSGGAGHVLDLERRDVDQAGDTAMVDFISRTMGVTEGLVVGQCMSSDFNKDTSGGRKYGAPGKYGAYRGDFEVESPAYVWDNGDVNIPNLKQAIADNGDKLTRTVGGEELDICEVAEDGTYYYKFGKKYAYRPNRFLGWTSRTAGLIPEYYIDFDRSITDSDPCIGIRLDHPIGGVIHTNRICLYDGDGRCVELSCGPTGDLVRTTKNGASLYTINTNSEESRPIMPVPTSQSSQSSSLEEENKELKAQVQSLEDRVKKLEEMIQTLTK